MILKRLRTTDLNPERAPLHSLLPGQGVQLKPCSSYSKPPKTKEADTTERLNNKKDQTSQSHSWGESLLIQVCRSHPSSYVPTQGWIRWPHSNSCWPRCDWTSLLLGLLPPTSTQFSRFINLVVCGTCKALQIDIWINGRDKQKKPLQKEKNKNKQPLQ